MHADDLKKLWLCESCKTGFIFHSDVEKHVQTSSHSSISIHDLESGESLVAADDNYGAVKMLDSASGL